MPELKQEKITLKVSDGTEMQVYVSQLAGTTPKAGLIVSQEAYGVNSHIRYVADRFAGEGYLVLAPELFHRTAPPGFEISYSSDFSLITPHFQGTSEKGFEADIRACFQWLETVGKVQKIGAVGYCMGGRASFIANSILPLKAAVSYYGGRIATESLARAKDQQGPLLMFWGGLDKHILPEHVKSVADALRAAGKEFVNVEFSKADHGFNCNDRAAYNATASDQAWALTLAFFKKHLG